MFKVGQLSVQNQLEAGYCATVPHLSNSIIYRRGWPWVVMLIAAAGILRYGLLAASVPSMMATGYERRTTPARHGKNCWRRRLTLRHTSRGSAD